MRLLFVFFCALALPLFAAERVVTPNWAMASTLTAMGFPPLAMGDKRIYPLWMSDPVQPPSVVDLGERYRPNRELLAQLPMSLVFDNFFYTHLRAVYPPEVPVVDVLFDGGNEAPQQRWASYVAATRRMGDAIGEQRGKQVLFHVHTPATVKRWRRCAFCSTSSAMAIAKSTTLMPAGASASISKSS